MHTHTHSTQDAHKTQWYVYLYTFSTAFIDNTHFQRNRKNINITENQQNEEICQAVESSDKRTRMKSNQMQVDGKWICAVSKQTHTFSWKQMQNEFLLNQRIVSIDNANTLAEHRNYLHSCSRCCFCLTKLNAIQTINRKLSLRITSNVNKRSEQIDYWINCFIVNW